MLTQPFYLGRYEVTQQQYEQIMEVSFSRIHGRDLPVDQVTWDEAQEFCKKASEKAGLAVRLPTEAQWEHGCRAGTKTTYYTGDTKRDLDRAGWYYLNSESKPHPVGQKTPNVWGVYDMHGNVAEWCSDWYADYGAAGATDPQGPSTGRSRVLRGGSWYDDPVRSRSAVRNGAAPDGRNMYVGFRVAADVPSKAP
jgi:formylglycine-generating enzyme required for sulfatase activity